MYDHGRVESGVTMIAGIGGGVRSGAAALAVDGRLVAACSQERATRVRGAGVGASGLPDEALDLLLQRLGRTRREIGRYVCAADDGPPPPADASPLDHHRAHASTAYLTSPFDAAAVVVCDHEAPEISVWTAQGGTLHEVSWSWHGPGFATVATRCARALGVSAADTDQRAAALARLRPRTRDAVIDRLFRFDADALVVDPGLESFIEARRQGPAADAQVPAALAAALQERLAELLLELLRRVQARVGQTRLCLGGSLFYNSAINTHVRESGVFAEVFVPVDPGNSGLAVGAAVHQLGRSPAPASPFLGPSYSAEETKRILDNCKLHYAWESEEGAIGVAVKALREGRLVGWFDGSMEWGPRALGARCILANPSAPYVLDNLNRFLKQREPWRGYALSGLLEAVPTYFDGPAETPFMDCDYRPRDASRFREALPAPDATVRVQTVSPTSSPPRFRRLLEHVGEVTGLPFVINTSFNGFHEPIVCSPRDAVRVFYGTGLDLLVMNQFVVSK